MIQASWAGIRADGEALDTPTRLNRCFTGGVNRQAGSKADFKNIVSQ